MRHGAFGKVAVLRPSGYRSAGADAARSATDAAGGEKVVRQHATETATQRARPPNVPVVMGLEGAPCALARQEARHFAVMRHGDRCRWHAAPLRLCQRPGGSADAFAQGSPRPGHADTPATVLCDGDATVAAATRGAAGGHARAGLGHVAFVLSTVADGSLSRRGRRRSCRSGSW